MLSKRRLMKWKIYLDRSKGYVGTLNMLLMGIVVLNTLPGYIGEWLRDRALWTYPTLFCGMGILTLIIGWMDDRTGLRKEELTNMFVNDPMHSKMMEKLKNIHKILTDNAEGE